MVVLTLTLTNLYVFIYFPTIKQNYEHRSSNNCFYRWACEAPLVLRKYLLLVPTRVKHTLNSVYYLISRKHSVKFTCGNVFNYIVLTLAFWLIFYFIFLLGFNNLFPPLSTGNGLSMFSKTKLFNQIHLYSRLI